MDLDRERGCRREQLHQIREPSRRAGDAALLGEPLPERAPVGHVRRTAGVVAEPHLGFVPAGGRAPLEIGDERRRTPVVVAGGVRHSGEHASRVRGVSGYPDLTMAVHTKHPASAPPAAPVREKTGHLMLRGWCIFVLFTALSGTAWLHAIGELPTAIMTIG